MSKANFKDFNPIDGFPYGDEDEDGLLNHQSRKRKRSLTEKPVKRLSDIRKKLEEMPETGVVLVFGRFNPPTTGHKKLLDKASAEASERGFDLKIFASQTQDKKKNPLSYNDKIAFMRKMFPKFGRNIIHKEDTKTIIQILKHLSTSKYDHLVLVVGSDRISDFKDLLTKYNGGPDYNYKSIEVVSAGERDPDSDDVSGMSASKLRQAASEGKFEEFKKGMPDGFEEVKNLYNAIRVGMGLKEMYHFRREVNLGKNELRENYLEGKLFQKGSKVEFKPTKEIFVIEERKPNFVVCGSENGKRKFWIKDLSPLEN